MLFVLGTLLLATTACLASAALRLPSVVAFGIAAYLFAWAEVVLLTELLSLFDAVSPAAYLLAEVVFLTVAAVAWHRRGRPRPGFPRLTADALRAHPIIVLLGAFVGAALVYEATVGLTTPATNVDELWYHLPRAAAWLNHGGVYQIPGGNLPENAYPPNAEIGVLYGFVLLGRDNAAALPQLLAQLALVAAIFGIARKLGYSRAAALFPALLALTLSNVALQSMTALNDLVVASFIASAVYLVLQPTGRTALVLAGLAVGLAVGTKLTALFALPILALLAAVALPRRRLALLAAAGVLAALVVGSYGYISNVAGSRTLFSEEARLVGGAPNAITARGTAATIARNAYRFVDLSGYRVPTAWLEPLASAGEHLFRLLHIPTAPPESSSATSPFLFEVNVSSDPQNSWFGPLGVLVVLPLSAFFAARWLLRRAPAEVGILGLALPLYLVAIALATRYTSVGRYFVTAIVLTLPLAAALYRRRLVAAAVATIGVLTLAFALAYDREKPTGLVAVDTPIWRLDRGDAQSLSFGDDVGRLLRTLDGAVPADEDLALDSRDFRFLYALYGRDLGRKLHVLPLDGIFANARRHGLTAVYVRPTVKRPRPAPGWNEEDFGTAGALFTSRG
jgi:hypothetical protein